MSDKPTVAHSHGSPRKEELLEETAVSPVRKSCTVDSASSSDEDVTRELCSELDETPSPLRGPAFYTPLRTILEHAEEADPNDASSHDDKRAVASFEAAISNDVPHMLASPLAEQTPSPTRVRDLALEIACTPLDERMARLGEMLGEVSEPSEFEQIEFLSNEEKLRKMNQLREAFYNPPRPGGLPVTKWAKP